MNSALGGIDRVISIKENFQTDINIESNKDTNRLYRSKSNDNF